jgi:hypothetical protein
MRARPGTVPGVPLKRLKGELLDIPFYCICSIIRSVFVLTSGRLRLSSWSKMATVQHERIKSKKMKKPNVLR